ncbi:MAG TPA: FAD-dependent 5-carboxymethylaminomethyl-2-thiouridine(34) oxidoreductase MnmC [Methylotenera sp.]|nr:FAD-dependent 5-carboxymethylaminomethyl-2-thiouridine(34) oxidoreductase MnmC [Methylotenera sp.]
MLPKTAIVIGSGIAGCSTAYALAQRGVHVSLLERHTTIASEASGNPLAMLYPRLSGDNVASQFALAGYLHSLRLFNSLDLESADFNACGLLQLGFNARELARIKKVAAQNHSIDILKYVSQQEASSLAGIDVLYDALYFPHAAWVNPQSLCKRLTQHENIEVYTSINISKIMKNNNLFEIYFNESLIKKADIVIIANANEAQHFSPSSHILTQAVRGQVTQLEATEASQKLQMIVCSDGYLSPAVNHQHSLGATFSSEPFSTNQADLAITEYDHLANLKALKTISNPFYLNLQNNVTAGRVALRCTTPDYFPLVGELIDSNALKTAPPRPNASTDSLPWIKGLYINVAHGSHGFTSAPLCAELLANLICNEPLAVSEELVSLLNPNRFLLRELGLKRLAKTIAISS